MGKIVVMDHPLIQHKIGIIRREETGSKDFRTLVSEIAMLMCYEATRDLKLADVEIDTPICKTTVKELKGKKLAVVPILRAGLGMVDGMLAMIPAAKVGHIGLYRDPETLEPVEYYCKLPADCANREVFVVDPMLATGGSSSAAIQMLKDKGVKNIRLMCIIAAPEGVKKMQKTKDFCVDENGWIHCPFCKCRTRTKIRADTSLKNFPIFCPKCKQECLIDADNMKIRLSVVPDAKTQSR